MYTYYVAVAIVVAVGGDVVVERDIERGKRVHKSLEDSRCIAAVQMCRRKCHEDVDTSILEEG